MTDRNFTTYNPQVVRDDVFMLGIDGTVKKNRMAVMRSSSAVVVSSQNANREWVYSQQQTFSAEGYSGQAFNPHFPHTTSSVGTTKNCTDCHLSKNNDNNAWMTQLLGFGTGTVNFFGRYAYVGEGRDGLHAVIWTEPDEPQAVIGSHLHKIAYPDNYRKHLEARRDSERSARAQRSRHSGPGVARRISLHRERPGRLRGLRRREYRSEGIFGAHRQRAGFAARSAHACEHEISRRQCRASEHARARSGAACDCPENEEQPIDLFYAFVYVSDREEGLVGSNVATLVDGNPDNNFLKRDVTFNPDGVLTGASFVTAAGHRLYLTTPRGLFVIDCTDPMNPRLAGQFTGNFLRNPHCVAIQFRYAFVTDDDGLKVLNITDPIDRYRFRAESSDCEIPDDSMSRALTPTSRTGRKDSRSSTWKIRSDHGSIKCSTPAARSTTLARCRSEV